MSAPADSRVARLKSFVASPAFPFTILAIVVFAGLGSPPLWGMEGRWGVICRKMMESGDYFNPKLLGQSYYDKPVLSYWLMIGGARLFGGLTEFALRLPSALAAMATAFCVHRLAIRLWNRDVARLAVWLLVGTWSFVQFSRVAAADLLNVAAVIGAITWYFERDDRPGFISHLGFFGILALGSLMKGLIAPAMALLALAPDLLRDSRWKRHLRLSLLPAAAVAALIYFAPFLASGAGGAHSGLGQVVQENFVRYFAAFDHNKDPFYLYFGYLPLYLVPWSLFLPFVLWRASRKWRELVPPSRWVLTACAILFLFLTLSSSRRPYYILPMIPLALLAIADWYCAGGPEWPSIRTGFRRLLFAGNLLLVAWFGIALPWSGTLGGTRIWSREVRQAAEARAPWPEWEIAMYGSPPNAAFYLHFPGDANEDLTREDDLKQVVEGLKRHPRTIVITRQKFLEELRSALGLKGEAVEERHRVPGWLPLKISRENLSVALIPSDPKDGH